MDKYAKLVESSTQSLTAATQALAMASQPTAQAQAKSQASDKSLKNATSLRPSQDSQGSGSSFFGFEQESVGRSEEH